VIRARDRGISSPQRREPQVVIAGHKTSVCLEDEFWKGLNEIASVRNKTVSDLIALIDAGREHTNLSSAVRLFILDFCRIRLAEKATNSMTAVRSARSA
jgi:predicted DNA-binding ribbon-helix-helix protein